MTSPVVRERYAQERSKGPSQQIPSPGKSEENSALKRLAKMTLADGTPLLLWVAQKLAEFSAWRADDQDNEDSVTSLLRCTHDQRGTERGKARMNTSGAGTMQTLADYHRQFRKIFGLHDETDANGDLERLHESGAPLRWSTGSEDSPMAGILNSPRPGSGFFCAGQVIRIVHRFLLRKRAYEHEVEQLRSKCGLGALTTLMHKLGDFSTQEEREIELANVAATGNSMQDLFAAMYQRPKENVLERIAGLDATCRVEFLLQNNAAAKESVVIKSLQWADCGKHAWRSSEFYSAVNAFYLARNGAALSDEQVRGLAKAFKRYPGAALFGGFGFRLSVHSADGSLVVSFSRVK